MLMVSDVHFCVRRTEFGGQAGQADRIWGAGGPGGPNLGGRRAEFPENSRILATF